MTYNHELSDWPKFQWKDSDLSTDLAEVRHRQGRLLGRMESLGFQLREESVLRTLTEEVVKSSEIEGELLDRDQVRSSIARRLGMDVAGMVPADRNVDGVVEMMLDATQNYAKPLTDERLFDWHAALFPTGRSGMSKITVGNWRDDRSGPMQVVSGPMGRETVHYEAPAAPLLQKEMDAFLKWFESEKSIDSVLVAGIAHLWFVTIHPFDDGNGRIARAITDLALSRSEHSSQRFYSMSSKIRSDRKQYYEVLERTQKGGLDITKWLQWFLGCLNGAFDQAESTLSTVLSKAEFWNIHRDTELNKRQKMMINRLLDGFFGKLNSSKWAKLTKTSQDTASRDIDDLVQKGILMRGSAGGRSTSYELVLPMGKEVGI
ncbi:MAG TPA: Fic family protein [Pyrinomonadaceae bacterium]|nr:Fic family protein [Pyrinomonadaceae bacterium]